MILLRGKPLENCETPPTVDCIDPSLYWPDNVLYSFRLQQGWRGASWHISNMNTFYMGTKKKKVKVSINTVKYDIYFLYTNKVIFQKHEADGRLHQCIVANVAWSCRIRAFVESHQANSPKQEITDPTFDELLQYFFAQCELLLHPVGNKGIYNQSCRNLGSTKLSNIEI